MTISDIIAYLIDEGFEPVPLWSKKEGPNIDIRTVRSLDTATARDITFAYGGRSAQGTMAAAVVTDTLPKKHDRNKTWILVNRPRYAIAKVAELFDRGALETPIPEQVVAGPGTVAFGQVSFGSGVRIGSSTIIGGDGFGWEWDGGSWFRVPHLGGVVIANDVEIGSSVCIDRGTYSDTLIGPGSKIDNLCHIAHNAQLGRNVIVVAGSVIFGSVKLEDDVWVGSAKVMEGVTVGAGATVGTGAVVTKDVEPGATVVGIPAKPIESKGKQRGVTRGG